MSAAEAAALPPPSKSAEAGGGEGDAELPKALLKRVIKAGLSQWDVAAGGDGKRDFQVNKVCAPQQARCRVGPLVAPVARPWPAAARLLAPGRPRAASHLPTPLQDALLACAEAGRLFIHYLTATANDACKDAKRQTISADDVLTALEDLDFGELVEPLRSALEGERGGTREGFMFRARECVCTRLPVMRAGLPPAAT